MLDSTARCLLLSLSAQMRRKAEPAREALQTFVKRWRDDKSVAGHPSHELIKGGFAILAPDVIKLHLVILAPLIPSGDRSRYSCGRHIPQCPLVVSQGAQVGRSKQMGSTAV